MRKLALAALLLAACSSSAPPPPPARSEFKNLQVFARDIPRETLINTMKGFTRSLGVRCNHCHVVTATQPKEELDFASDAKETKRVARVMIRMTGDLNAVWLPRVEAAEHAGASLASAEAEESDEEKTVVSCWTCHRGKGEPEKQPAPSR